MRLFLLPLLALALGCGARSDLEDLPISPGPAPSASAAAPLCPGASLTPVQLATIDNEFAFPVALTVAADHLYYGVFIEAGPQNGTGSIWRLPVAGGTPELFEDGGYDYGPLVHDATNLYYPEVVYGNSTSAHTGVIWHSLADPSSLGEMPGPVSTAGGPLYETDLVGTAAGPAWLMSDPSPGGETVLVYSDGLGLGTWIVAWVFQLAIAGDWAFLASNQRLYRGPVAGGEADPVRELSLGADLLGATGDALFFTPEGSSIVRRDVASGAESTLATSVPFYHAATGGRVAAWVDAPWLYYAELETLKRIPLAGGEPEVVFHEPGRQIQAITTDACHVYWAVTQGSDGAAAAVLAKAKD